MVMKLMLLRYLRAKIKEKSVNLMKVRFADFFVVKLKVLLMDNHQDRYFSINVYEQ